MSEAITTQNNGLAVFEKTKSQIAEIIVYCDKIVINNEDTLAKGKDVVASAKKYSNEIEKIRVDLTKPYLEAQRNIKSIADDLKNMLDKGIKPLSDRILNYELEQRRIREAEQARLAEEARKKEEELKAIAAANAPTTTEVEKKVEEFKAVQAQAAAVAAPVKDNIKSVWTFEVLDFSKVPLEFLMLNEAKINQAIRGGARDISGLRIFEELKSSIRAK